MNKEKVMIHVGVYYIHTYMIYMILPFETVWMKYEDIMLSEINLIEENPRWLQSRWKLQLSSPSTKLDLQLIYIATNLNNQPKSS